MKMRNYKCTYNNSLDDSSIPFSAAEVFSNAAAYKAAVEYRSQNDSFVFLPLTNTLEAELQAALINEKSFIRVKNPVVPTVAELLPLKAFDYDVPHYKILTECLQLPYDKPLAYEMSGLYSFLSLLTPIETVFRSFRKNPELENEITSCVLENYFSLIQRLKKTKIQMISLADPVASLDIIGGSALTKLIQIFYVPLIRYIQAHMNCVLYLCPKLSYAMEDLNILDVKTIEVKKIKTQDAIISMLDSKSILGNICINTNAEIDHVKIFSLHESITHETILNEEI